ncbi:uncharacterized protein [Pyxicephalus adspersus]
MLDGEILLIILTAVQDAKFVREAPKSFFIFARVVGGVHLLAVFSAVVGYVCSKHGSSSIQDGNPIAYSDFMTPRPPDAANSNPRTPQEQP